MRTAGVKGNIIEYKWAWNWQSGAKHVESEQLEWLLTCKVENVNGRSGQGNVWDKHDDGNGNWWQIREKGAIWKGLWIMAMGTCTVKNDTWDWDLTLSVWQWCNLKWINAHGLETLTINTEGKTFGGKCVILSQMGIGNGFVVWKWSLATNMDNRHKRE